MAALFCNLCGNRFLPGSCHHPADCYFYRLLRCAVECIAAHCLLPSLVENIIMPTRDWVWSSKPVIMQWVHSHMCISRNKEASKLVNDGLWLPYATKLSTPSHRLCRHVRPLFEDVADPNASSLASLYIYKDFNTRPIPLLLRVGTGSCRI